MTEIIKMCAGSVRARVSDSNFFDHRFDKCIIGIKDNNNVCYHITKLKTSCIEMVYQDYALQIEMGEMDDQEICRLGLLFFKSLCNEAKSWAENNPIAPIICHDLIYLSTFDDLEENSKSEFEVRTIE